MESNRLAVRERGSVSQHDWSTGRPIKAPISDVPAHQIVDAKEYEHVLAAKKREPVSQFSSSRSITPPRSVSELRAHTAIDAKENEHVRSAARLRMRELGMGRAITPPTSITSQRILDTTATTHMHADQMRAAQATAREARLSTPSKARRPSFQDKLRTELSV